MNVQQKSTSETYKLLLKTKEWRKFSDRVKGLFGNVCQSCRMYSSETNVHHHYYEAGRLPWEYDIKDVTLLCPKCHRGMHQQLQNFRTFVFPKLKPRELQVLTGALLVALENNNALEVVHAIASMCASPASIKRFAYEGRQISEPNEIQD